MAITTSCPGCKSLFRLPDTLAGQTVRCQKCEALFPVPMVVTGPPVSPASPSASAPSSAMPPAPPEIPAPPAVKASPVPPAPATPETVAPPVVKAAPEPPALPIAAPPIGETKPMAQPPASPEVSKTPAEAKPAAAGNPAEPAAPAVPAAPGTPPPLPKAPAAPEPPPPSAYWSLVALAMFFAGAILTGTIAAFWVYSHIVPRTPVTFVAPPRPVIHNGPRAEIPPKGPPFGFKDGAWPKKIPGNATPTPWRVLIDFNGRANVDGSIETPAPGVNHGRFGNDGPYRLYRVQLVQGRNYHFYVNTNGLFKPRIEILDGPDVVASKKEGNTTRVLVAFRPKRTAEYQIFVTSQERIPNPFFLSIAPEMISPPIAGNFAFQTRFLDVNFLRLQDPLDPAPPDAEAGPHREYEFQMQANQEYVFTVFNANFRPMLRILENGMPNDWFPNDAIDPNRIRFTYRAPQAGNVRVRIYGSQYALGNYTLTVEHKQKQLQTILAVVDAEGKYTDQRALTATDLNEPAFVGRGLYKSYLLVGLEKGKKYTVEMTSNTYDTYLGVYDPLNRQVAVHVSPVGARKASITFEATAAGNYRVHAASARPTDMGTYTLRVTPTP